MNMLALHTDLSLRQDTPRNFDVEFLDDDVFRLCSCRFARRKFSNLLSVLMPFLWSTDSSGHSPVDIAHAVLWARSLRPKKTLVKYPLFFAGVVNASVLAYLVFHLAHACLAVHLASSEKCKTGRSRQKNNPVFGLYSMASIKSFGFILDILKNTPKGSLRKDKFIACPGFNVPKWHSQKET